MQKEKTNKIVTFIKIIIGIALLLSLLLWNDNGSKILKIFKEFNWSYLIILIFISIGLNLISCLKWQLFLKERGNNVSLGRLFVLYLIGKFFNNFMPSMIGGDITRIYLLGKQINSQSQSAASVIMERFTGILALILLAILFSLLNISLLSEPIIGLSFFVMIFACVFFFVFLFYPKVLNFFFNIFSFLPFVNKIAIKMESLRENILYFKSNTKLLLLAMLYSFVFHLLTSANVYFASYAIGFQPSFLDIALVTPIILLLSNIPISPNNIGWWEWSFSVLLVSAGAGAAEGVAVALTVRAVSYIFSLFGGVFFLFEKIKTSTI